MSITKRNNIYWSIFTPWLMLCCLLAAEALTSRHHQHHEIVFGGTSDGSLSWRTKSQKTSFWGGESSLLSVKPSFVRSASLKMDVEEPAFITTTGGSSSKQQRILKGYNVRLNSHKTLLQIPKPSQQTPHYYPSKSKTEAALSVDEALQQYGLPWTSSIDPTYSNPATATKTPFYMPFFEWQIQFMKDNLTNLRVVPTQSKTGRDLSYIERRHTTPTSHQGDVRMVTLTFASDEYRKIRMTVYDAGNQTQVFTSLWYPQPHFSDAPVLGIDLLQFHSGSRHLCVVDFQPITTTTSQTAPSRKSKRSNAPHYEDLLKPIRDQYPSLQGQMTKRFYDSNQFFSNQMLYSRFEHLSNNQLLSNASTSTTDGQPQQPQHPVFADLFPAYQQYVQTHLDWVRATPTNPLETPRMLQSQAAYDSYNADRDPAHAMFTKVFGPEFADAFVYDVLFSYSTSTQRNQEACENK